MAEPPMLPGIEEVAAPLNGFLKSPVAPAPNAPRCSTVGTAKLFSSVAFVTSLSNDAK